ncbi:MAG TPA: ATP-binding protein [Solirubrobacterales bacterium]|nr:ATP-binding protein [Solirubrobacterales bacterium]
MKFKVEPRLLDHFGVAMYNTVPKAIAELCANAYDADATRVVIDYADDAISILDNGTGMTKTDLEEGYLRLGRDRRDVPDGELTKKGRAVIGNKGIGKLAGFGIAETMLVRTWRGSKQISIRLNRDELEEADDLESFEIEPIIARKKRGTHGTEVQLIDLIEDVILPEEQKLREYLARHLPSSPGWTVNVNGVECSSADIPGKRVAISETIKGFGKVNGFYIVANDRRGLDAGFAVRVRGRIVQERSLFGLNQQAHGFFNVARIVGEIEPDFLDPVGGSHSRREQFVINTSRSGFNPEDPGVQALNEWANGKLKAIADGLAKERSKERKRAALKRTPELEARLKELGPEVYAKLDEALDSVISKLSKNESDETVDMIVDLIIRYYESDALRVILETIREAAPKEVERLSKLLAEYGAARVGEVTGTLHTQIEVIEVLRRKVAEGVLEAEIHKIIAKNIWLLRDDLTYWFDNKPFATTLGQALKRKFKLSARKRPDLVCFDDRPLREKQGQDPQRLLVVEFKRPGVRVGLKELTQVMQYKNIFEESLGNIDAADIEVIVLGDKFDTGFDRKSLNETPNYKIMSYEELLVNAGDRYRDLYRRLVPEGLGSMPPSPEPDERRAAPKTRKRKVPK